MVERSGAEESGSRSLFGAAPTPNRSRASARNSSSLPHWAASASSARRRNSRRAQARWFVTWVTGRPSSSRQARVGRLLGGVGTVEVVPLEDRERRLLAGSRAALPEDADGLGEERAHPLPPEGLVGVGSWAAARQAQKLALGAFEVERQQGPAAAALLGPRRRALVRRRSRRGTRGGRSGSGCGPGRRRRRSPSRRRGRRSPGSGPRRPRARSAPEAQVLVDRLPVGRDQRFETRAAASRGRRSPPRAPPSAGWRESAHAGDELRQRRAAARGRRSPTCCRHIA